MIFLCKVKSVFDDSDEVQVLYFVKVADSFNKCLKSIVSDYREDDPNMKEHLVELKVKALDLFNDEFLVTQEQYDDLNDMY